MLSSSIGLLTTLGADVCIMSGGIVDGLGGTRVTGPSRSPNGF
jgi:hypothetical protein